MSTEAGYAGDITPSEAMEKLASGKGAVLIDVRTTAEWKNVGIPDLAPIKAEPIFLEWLSYPAMAQNAEFAASLEAELQRRGASDETPL
jgi:rhodanese-related sulfurtransferase